MATAQPAEKQIAAENLGPIEELTVKLSNHGVTVLSAPNGSGKSIFLDAAAKLAKGGGKVPLKDHARKGKVDGFGAAITIGRSSRYAGEFEVQSLEGRFDLAELVDPKLKSPTAADTRRIKALVGLTGVTADPNLFASHDAFCDFGDVVPNDVSEFSDLVEMAGYVKRSYEQEARRAEKAADTAFGEANACQAMAGEYDADLAGLSPVELSAELQAALSYQTELKTRASEYERAVQRRQTAVERLRELEDAYDGPDIDTAESLCEASGERLTEQAQVIADLEAELQAARNKFVSLKACNEQNHAALKAATQHRDLVAQYNTVVDAAMPDDVDAEAMDEALYDVQVSQERLEAAAVARQSAAADHQAKEHKQLALRWRQKAERLRDAGKSTDEVLSSAITCDVLRVESTGGETRLVVDHPRRGKSVPYHELSEGERWRIAIQLGAAQVGEGGLLVIPQEAFESLDTWVRDEIHAEAVQQQVYILTAEATREKSDGDGMTVRQYEVA
jgi:hypothetical protein